MIRRYPLVAFYLLCVGITWPLATQFEVSLILPLLGLLAPGVAAIIVTAVVYRRQGLRRLLGRMVIWKVHPFWYVFAIALPALLAIAAWALNTLVGAAVELNIARISPLALALALLVVGEELGWRGFLLPLLLTRLSATGASLVIGVLWGFWHLPNFYLPGYPQQGLPLVAFILSTVAYSVIFSFLFLHTRGSVLLATVLHAAINLFAPVGIDPVRQYWLETLVWGGMALCLWLFLGPDLARGDARASRLHEQRGKAVS